MPHSSNIAQTLTEFVPATSPARLRRGVRALGRLFACFTSMALLGLTVASAQAAPKNAKPRPFSITKASPELDALIAPDAKLRTVASGFAFIDGPVWVRGHNGAPGYLLASSIFGNVIYKVTPAGHVSPFLDKAGYSGTDFAHDGKLSYIDRIHMILIGPNCTGIDLQGRLIWCAGQDRALMRLEKNGTRTVLTNNYKGKRFNGPNDVAITKDGAIYFTDSDVGLRGGINGGLAQMPDSVWRWKAGKLTMVVSRKELGAEPNGIALSPDDKYLYLSAGTGSKDPKMMRYPVKADGSVGPGVVFTHGPGIGDGMKTDRRGDIYSSGAEAPVVRITSPNGKLLGLLNLPTPGDVYPPKLICASSLAFGGDDAKTLYITACNDIYAIRLKSPGILEGPAHWGSGGKL